MTSSLKLTAVICTYNRYDLIDACVSSLMQQKKVSANNFNILIVDNTPSGKRQVIAENEFDNKFSVEVIVSEPPGLSQARNTALDYVNDGIVAFIDDDALASELWAFSLLNTFRSDSNIACVGGKVIPKWPQELSQPAWMPDEFLWFLSMISWEGSTSRPLKSNEWLVGANIAFIPSRMKQATRFDTNLGRNGTNQGLLSNEENLFVSELKSQGLGIFYDPNAFVEHIIPVERINKKWFVQRIVWQAVSDWIMNQNSNPNSFNIALKDIYEMPFEYKNILAISLPSEDSSIVSKQRDILYNVIFAALNGFDESC